MNPANQSLPPGYSASDIVPVGGDQSQPSSPSSSLPPGYSADDIVPVGGDQSQPSSQSSSLPPGYSTDDVVPTDNTPTQEAPQPQTFTTPGGQTFQVGQSVQHSDGTHGEITGQHQDTGKAMIKYHVPPAKNWKQGDRKSVV